MQARALILFSILFFVASLLYGRIMIDGDGLTYYALARSVLEDRDVDLKNQRQQIPNLHLKINPKTRRIASHFSFGFGPLYAPLLFVSQKLTPPAWAPYLQNKIIPFSHALGVFLGSLLFGFMTMILMYTTCVQSKSESPGRALFASTAVLIGTPLLFYVFTMPSYAHAADAFLAASAFYLTVTAQPWFYRNWSIRNILIGVVLALSVLLRNNNIVLILPMMLGILYRDSKKNDRNPMLVLFEVFIGALPFIILLARFNLSQYGAVFATGYRVQVEEYFLGEMLFHPDAGLFIWTPVVVFGFTGLIIGTLRRHLPAVLGLVSVILVLMSIQFQPNWWGGCAFGPRFFTHLAPFWAWGIFECLQLRIRIVLSAAIFVTSIWTFFLLHIFFINAASREFRSMLRENKCRRSPADMISFASSDYISARDSGDVTNIFEFWFRTTGEGRYPTVLPLLIQRGSTVESIEFGQGE